VKKNAVGFKYPGFIVLDTAKYWQRILEYGNFNAFRGF
jgi:hypothetical protein